jgi:hypothetical protein
MSDESSVEVVIEADDHPLTVCGKFIDAILAVGGSVREVGIEGHAGWAYEVGPGEAFNALVAACEAARDALYPEYADVKIGDGPEYARCPTCDGKGWSPGRVAHADDCALILCEAAVERAKVMPEE